MRLVAIGMLARLVASCAHPNHAAVRLPEDTLMITEVAFHAGWPNAFSAVPIAKDVFEKRGK